MLSTFLLIEKMGKNLWWRYVAQIFSNFVTNKEKFLPLILLFRDLRAIHMKEGFDICSMFVLTLGPYKLAKSSNLWSAKLLFTS